jgi:hypothetical protein
MIKKTILQNKILLIEIIKHQNKSSKQRAPSFEFLSLQLFSPSYLLPLLKTKKCRYVLIGLVFLHLTKEREREREREKRKKGLFFL